MDDVKQDNGAARPLEGERSKASAHLPNVGGLSLEEFARLRALLDAGRPKREVLAGVGLDIVRWEQAEEDWLIALADDLERGDQERLRAFEAAYQRAWPARAPRAQTVAAAPPEEHVPEASNQLSTAVLDVAMFMPPEALPFRRAADTSPLDDLRRAAHAPQANALPGPCATQPLPPLDATRSIETP